MAHHNRITRNSGGVVGRRHDIVVSNGVRKPAGEADTEFDIHMNGEQTAVRNATKPSSLHMQEVYKPDFDTRDREGARATNLRIQQQACEQEFRTMASVDCSKLQAAMHTHSDVHAAVASTLYDEPAGERGMVGQFTDGPTALRFMLAGSATITIVGRTTRYTYKIKAAELLAFGKVPVWFVNLLAGPDNESDFQYLGMIKHNEFKATSKSRMRAGSKPFDAFAWLWQRLTVLGRVPLPHIAQLWHEGRCGRCNRKLTVPQSIATGFGPECAGKVGL